MAMRLAVVLGVSLDELAGIERPKGEKKRHRPGESPMTPRERYTGVRLIQEARATIREYEGWYQRQLTRHQADGRSAHPDTVPGYSGARADYEEAMDIIAKGA
jgi:hypothetical protein